jgi:hypothetical protein
LYNAGVSGPVDILSDGNRDDPIFSIATFGTTSWTQIGSINEDGILVSNYSDIVWPDSSTGKATSYSKQHDLHCPAGMEPIQTSLEPVIYGCAQCRVGYYSSYVGPTACLACPDGTDCNDVGIEIPCISSGYWRAEPPNLEDHGDFNLYPVYSCDIVEGCVSGCELNDTCAVGREGTSVTCGVCLEGYYLNFRGKCLECAENAIFNPFTVIMIYLSAICLIGVLFFVILKLFAAGEIKALEDCAPKNEDRGSSSSSQPRVDSSEQGHFLSKFHRLVTKAKSNALEIFPPQNFRDVMITSKIVLAFIQVMGAFFLLDVSDMSSWFQDFFEHYNINPFRGNEDVVACSSIVEVIPSYYFIVLNCFFQPIIIVGMFGIISAAVYYYYRLRLLKKCRNSSLLSGKKNTRLTSVQKANCLKLSTQISTIFSRIVLWLCLVFYPSVCSIILSVFNCRDFGVSGVWLRVDNEISCENKSYTAYVVLASAGIVLYVAGIPILFFYAIKNRHARVWQFSARFLHHGFVGEWKYFEIVDLTRKLLITSVSQFVASPSSSSQVLFMLMVNCCSLYLLATATPYQHPNDNNLSTVLTFIECIAFLFALLIISGISEAEGYSEVRLFSTLIAMLVIGVLIVTPYTFMTKVDYFKMKIDAVKSDITGCFVHYFPGSTEVIPDLSRWSRSGRERESFLSSERMSSMSSAPIGFELTTPPSVPVSIPSNNAKDIHVSSTVTSPLQSQRDDKDAT